MGMDINKTYKWVRIEERHLGLVDAIVIDVDGGKWVGYVDRGIQGSFVVVHNGGWQKSVSIEYILEEL